MTYLTKIFRGSSGRNDPTNNSHPMSDASAQMDVGHSIEDCIQYQQSDKHGCHTQPEDLSCVTIR
jgi:hypothetical protein